MIYLLRIIALLLLGVQTLAQQIPARPQPKRLLHDFAAVLTEPKRTEALEYKLEKYNDSCGIEILIVTVENLHGMDVEKYSKRLVSQWEDSVEKAKTIFILFDEQERGFALLSGAKLEHKFSKTINDKIEEDYLKRHFRSGEYYEGFNKAADVIVNFATDKMTLAQMEADDPYSMVFWIVLLIVGALIIYPTIQYIRFIRSKNLGTRKYGFINAFMMANKLGKHKKDGSFDNFSKGKGPFSGTKFAQFGGGSGGTWSNS